MAKRVVQFSPNGEYLAYSTPDGTLKLWETVTGNIKQEYTPSSHLSASCSCLCWSPKRQSLVSSKKKRKKRRTLEAEPSVASSDLIALGTTNGTILIYNVLKGDLHLQLDGGHSDTVHSVCWSADGCTLYSCSSDQHIIEWDLTTAKVVHKWKADTGGVYSINLCCSGRNLLSAGRAIKLWDLETHSIIKTYAGHATEVFQLVTVPMPDEAEGSGDAPNNETAYFLSAAQEDRLVHAWRTDKASKEKHAVASFSLPEEPMQMIVQFNTSLKSILLGVVTSSGQLLMFEHVLNGFLKKPLKPKHVIQLATESSEGETPHPIPVLAAHICDDSPTSVLISHGIFLRPTFERHQYSSLNPSECFVRRDPRVSVVSMESSVSKVKTPVTSKDLTVLAPGHMTPSGPAQQTDTSQTKIRKKRKNSITAETTLDERLHAISIDNDKPSESSSNIPKADTLITLLTQGLQSGDKKLLNSVLQHHGDRIVTNTVRRLPVTFVVPLVKELSRRMHSGHAQSGHTLAKWLRITLSQHAAYLLAFPELVESLSSIYAAMESRVTLFTRVSRLQGKLDLMLSQISSQAASEDALEAGASSQQPLLLYNDESSDEDSPLVDDADLVADQTESEGDWDGDSKQSDDSDDSDDDENGMDHDNAAQEDSSESEEEEEKATMNGIDGESSEDEDGEGDESSESMEEAE